MNNSIPVPKNEPVFNYAPTDPQTQALKNQLAKMSSSEIDIPVIINGEEIRTGKTKPINPPP